MVKKPIFIDEKQYQKITDISLLQKKPKKAVNEDAIDFYYSHLMENHNLFTKFVKENFPFYEQDILSQFADAPPEVMEMIMSLNRENLEFYHLELPKEKDKFKEIFSDGKHFDAYMVLKADKLNPHSEIVKMVVEIIKKGKNQPHGDLKLATVIGEGNSNGEIEVFLFISKINGEIEGDTQKKKE